MLKELSWYIEKNRFTEITEEIEEKAEAYRQSVADGQDDSDQRREEFRRLCQWHMEKSGYRNSDSSFIDVDSEFLSGSEINRKALDTFEKEIIKAHMYQKHLWEFMGTTGTMTVITKTEMASNGQKYEDYLPIAFKKDNKPKSPISRILAETPGAIPIYLYPDGTVSTEYDGTRSKARFDTIKDRSGFDWGRKGWDPNYEVKKEGWHGEFDEDNSWTMVREGHEQPDPAVYSGARFDRFPEIEILKDGDNAILYDPQYSLLSTFERIYLVSDGDVYGAETTDAAETARLIKNAMADMGIETISAVCGGRAGQKTSKSMFDSKGKEKESGKAATDKNILGLYRKLLGDVLSENASVKSEKEYAHAKEVILRKAEDERKSSHGTKLAEKIRTARNEGARGGAIISAVVSGKVNVPVSAFDEQDKKLAGLTDEEFSLIQTYDVPDKKKALFSTAVLNLILDRKELLSTGKPVSEFLDAAYEDIVLGKTSDETISLETTFSELCNNPEKSLKAEHVDEGVMKQLVQAKDSLPKQKHHEIQARVDGAVDNIIRNFSAVRMSTGMTPEEAVRLAARTVGGKDSDVFVPPASGIVYKSGSGRSSGYGNTDNDRRIFSDIKLSEFIEKAKSRPGITKEVELGKLIRRMGKVSSVTAMPESLPNLLNKAEREAWYRTDEFKATALSIEEVERLAAMEEEGYVSMKSNSPSETRSYSTERELDEKYGHVLPGDRIHESPVMARIVPATRSRSGQETVRRLEEEHASSESARHQEAGSPKSGDGPKFRAALIDASGRISRQITAAVWSDRLLQDKYGKEFNEERNAHGSVNGNNSSSTSNDSEYAEPLEGLNGKETSLVNSTRTSAGKSSGTLEYRTSDAVSHGNFKARNVPDAQTDLSFKGDAVGHWGVESGHEGFTADSVAKTPSSKPARQKNSGNVNEDMPDASLNHAGAVVAPEQEEAARLERMNANYEHDRAILAKTDPAFVKNRFLDVGHAEGSGEESDREIKKATQKLQENMLEKINSKQL